MHKRDLLDKLNNDNDDARNNSNINKKKTKKNNNQTVQSSFLEFIPLQHTHQLHNSSITLPNPLQSATITSYIIFLQFFSPKQIEIIVQNTNIYAYYNKTKRSEENGSKWVLAN